MAGNDDRRGLFALSELRDYEVSDGEPDPRGWDVFAGDGVRIGRVEELLVDRDALRVRALELRIDEDALHLPHGDRALFIPIRAVTLEETSERAVIPDVRSDQVGSLRGRTDFESFGGAGAIGTGATGTGRDEGVRLRERGRTTGEVGGMQGTTRSDLGGMQGGARSDLSGAQRGDIGGAQRGDTGGLHGGARRDVGATPSDVRREGTRPERFGEGDLRTRDESERGRRG